MNYATFGIRQVVRYQATIAVRTIRAAFSKGSCDIAANDEIAASPVVNLSELISQVIIMLQKIIKFC
jgi:hypothetical protein